MKKNIIYIATTFLLVSIVFVLCNIPIVQHLVESFELKSFDIRQNLTTKNKVPSDDIVILAIDDNSLEILSSKYGAWPFDRRAYVDIINSLEKAGARQIVFDLMFLNSSANKISDKALINAITENKNVFIAMNFDNRQEIEPPVLPSLMGASLDVSASKVTFPDYKNCRIIMKELLKNPKNVGIINCQRDFDGVSRAVPSFLTYQKQHYPYLGLLVFSDFIKDNSFKIENKNLVISPKNYPIQNNGYMILNFYHKNFNAVPFWKMDKSLDMFKDKTVFVGVTATSMYDIKTTPISSNVAGVELMSTMFNNFLDNNFINKAHVALSFVIAVILSVIVVLVTMKAYSAFSALLVCLGVLAVYMWSSVLILDYFNLWVDVISVAVAIIASFIVAYAFKYKFKSRDFEHTYKLATTDGMTGLYNHRFFQEQMLLQIENAKRYNGKFSFLIIDIDFFKKFNDTYGHQAGDAVLIQVADLLRHSVRSSDMVFRYGGEEMAIILPNTDFEHAITAAQKICEKIATTPFHLNAKVTVNVTISLGGSTYPEHGATPTELIEYADKGLYKAKEAGRNQVGIL